MNDGSERNATLWWADLNMQGLTALKARTDTQTHTHTLLIL